MSEHDFINELEEKCDLFGLQFTDIYAHIERLVENENIKFFYITKETTALDLRKGLILDVFIITNNSVCIGHSVYKDGNFCDSKFLLSEVKSIEKRFDKNNIVIAIFPGFIPSTLWTVVDKKVNEEKLVRFHLDILNAWRTN